MENNTDITLKKLQKILLFALDLLYPNVCGCCGEIILWDKLLCENCLVKLCELETPDNLSCYFYKDTAKDGIVQNKDRNKNFGIHCGVKLAEKLLNLKTVPDFVVPVPMYKFKKKYNHAEIIAKISAKVLNIPLRCDILYKVKGSPEQHSLGYSERSKYLDFFRIKNISLENKTIVLIDDVVTTGNTMEKCATLLKSQGADMVIQASACVAQGR